jgi:flagellar basal body P-ring formation chaperone FlgA
VRTLLLIASIFLLAFLAAPRVEASGLQIALLASTEVQSDTILLANLMPASASRRVREAAEKVALGSTPQSGTTRQLSHDTLNSAIELAGLAPSDFDVPASVVVRRRGRLLSREEIFAAIDSSLSKKPIPGIPRLQPKDLFLEVEIRVPQGDPGLEVTQISFDQLIGSARIRLRARSAPALLPFYVIARIPSALSASAPGVRTVLNAESIPGSVPSSNANSISIPILVAANQPARLHMHSANMDMILEVTPLQPGRLGDLIRVRLPGSGRTLRAQVAAEGYLDATL